MSNHPNIADCPTINDAALLEMGGTRDSGWPSDEARTTAEIYAAAEAIRERRPRQPVGFEVIAVEVTETMLLGLERIGRNGNA